MSTETKQPPKNLPSELAKPASWANTVCSICGDTGWYMGYRYDYGNERRKYKCGCAYKDALETGHFAKRIPKPNVECRNRGNEIS